MEKKIKKLSNKKNHIFKFLHILIAKLEKYQNELIKLMEKNDKEISDKKEEIQKLQVHQIDLKGMHSANEKHIEKVKSFIEE